MLDIINVKKTFNKGTINEKKALNGINLHLNEGDFVTVIGGNGAGKSTTLNMIAGVYPIDSGKIEIDGVNISRDPEYKRAKYIGRVFQDPMLGTAAGMEIQENLALAFRRGEKRGLGWGIKSSEKDGYREALARLGLGLEDRMSSKVGLLSGGQRQRVAFARALAPNPQLLLLDEPFAAIDAKVRQELRSWLKEMIEKLGITSIFVTHDQDEAIEVADEIIITNKGHIEQKGTPLEIYQNPQTAFAATFFGQTSQITNYQSFHSFPKVDNVDKAIIRPEFVKVSKKNEVQRFGPSASEGVVERVSFRGDSLELLVNVNDNQIIAKRGLEEKSIAVGEKVDVFIYRLFVTVGEKAMLLENQSLVDDSVFI